MSKRGENIYKRKDGRWEGRILKPDGKYIYLYGKSYREVREKKKNTTNHEVAAQNSTIAKTNATALFQNWLKNQFSGCIRRSTYDSYYYCIYKYVIPFFQSGEDQLSECRVRKFVQAVAINQQLSVSYRRKIISIFKTAVRAIIKEIGISISTINDLQFPKMENSTVEVFASKEQIRIEQAILSSNDFRTYGILLCFYTGIRLGELCALRWENIDLESGIMSITATTARVKNHDPQGHKTIMVTGTPKSRSSCRKIPIPAFMTALIKNIASDDRRETDYVFSSTDKPVEPRTIQRLYKKILKSANVNERKFHVIRHTFATRALELGIDIKTLSEILGHSSVGITLNIYAHSMLEQKKIAIQKMNSMYLSHEVIEICTVNEAVV
ncbi:site-specific integrase [Petroclostridium sp. X23]|uniref:tyrosine-type recombinase/integrase n=1 Tax=Petroclostridium sp. X23 TaxID=3045146 RepID=UPI0024AE6A3E|nr:site-specific integrase [Petroclostridium sp. X23]WHH57934.1 site-specific integrase [Petroclostridium sp. X23]